MSSGNRRAEGFINLGGLWTCYSASALHHGLFVNLWSRPWLGNSRVQRGLFRPPRSFIHHTLSSLTWSKVSRLQSEIVCAGCIVLKVNRSWLNLLHRITHFRSQLSSGRYQLLHPHSWHAARCRRASWKLHPRLSPVPKTALTCQSALCHLQIVRINWL